jgi:hypothetical protein
VQSHGEARVRGWPLNCDPTFIRLVRTRADIADLTATYAHTTATKAPASAHISSPTPANQRVSTTSPP